jgi:hypothetical protein
VRWHTESPLIECHEGHQVSFHGRGERRVLWHTANCELRYHHKPLLHKFLQMAQHNGERSPILLCHGSRRKGSNTSEISVFFLLPFLSLSPLSVPLSFSSVGKEVRRG